MSTFYSVQRRNSGKKIYQLLCMRSQWTLILIFCVDVHMGLDPLPVQMRPPEPDPLPLPCGRHKLMAPKFDL